MATTGSAPATPKLGTRFSGEVLTPDHPAYEPARRVHNGLIDKRPAVIARCRRTADVVEAVNYAREHRLEISVRGGDTTSRARPSLTAG